jgi:hypothetical protein
MNRDEPEASHTRSKRKSKKRTHDEDEDILFCHETLFKKPKGSFDKVDQTVASQQGAIEGLQWEEMGDGANFAVTRTFKSVAIDLTDQEDTNTIRYELDDFYKVYCNL